MISSACRLPWSAKLLAGRYSGFNLEFHSPDGAVRNINFELDQGTSDSPSRPRHDDPIILLAIDPKAIHVAPMNALDGWRFDAKGIRQDGRHAQTLFHREQRSFGPGRGTPQKRKVRERAPLRVRR